MSAHLTPSEETDVKDRTTKRKGDMPPKEILSTIETRCLTLSIGWVDLTNESFWANITGKTNIWQWQYSCKPKLRPTKINIQKFRIGLPPVSLNTGICHQPQRNALGDLTPRKIPLTRWTKIPEMWKKFHEIDPPVHQNILYTVLPQTVNIYLSVQNLQQLDYWMPKKGSDKNRQLKDTT